MDKNSIIGLLLITGIMLGWFLLSKPSKEEMDRRKKMIDSMEVVQKKDIEQKALFAAKQDSAKKAAQVVNHDTTASATVAQSNSDSLKTVQLTQKFGDFASASQGEKKELTIENKLIKATISTLGGQVTSVLLKNYLTSDKKPLVLFTEDSTTQTLVFDHNRRTISTKDFYFTPEVIQSQGKDSSMLSLRL